MENISEREEDIMNALISQVINSTKFTNIQGYFDNSYPSEISLIDDSTHKIHNNLVRDLTFYLKIYSSFSPVRAIKIALGYFKKINLKNISKNNMNKLKEIIFEYMKTLRNDVELIKEIKSVMMKLT